MISDEHLENSSPASAAFLTAFKRLRQSREMSYSRVAREATARGVQLYQPTVQRIEDGTRPVRLHEAEVLAQVLGTTLDQMIRIDDVQDALGFVRTWRTTVQQQAGQMSGIVQQWFTELDDAVSQLRYGLEQYIAISEGTNNHPVAHDIDTTKVMLERLEALRETLRALDANMRSLLPFERRDG